MMMSVYVTRNIIDYNCLCVYVCVRETWTEEAYGSCHVKSLCEDRVFEYRALAHDDASMFLIYQARYVK